MKYSLLLATMPEVADNIFCESFWANLTAIMVAVIGGLIVHCCVRITEKRKVCRMLYNDLHENWLNIDMMRLTTDHNQNTFIFRGIDGLNLKGAVEYEFGVFSLRLFETEGARISKYLNKRESKIFWELVNKLYNLEETRKILLSTNSGDHNYKEYQKMFMEFAQESSRRYSELVGLLRKKKINFDI